MQANNIQKSLLDNDLYKFTMQQAVLDHYPSAVAKYEFINRRLEDKFTPGMRDAIIEAIQALGTLRLTEDEYNWLKKWSFLSPAYLEYLKSYRFDPQKVSVRLIGETFSHGQLEISVAGPWHRTILWEVPLMAIISQVYFEKLGHKITHEGWNSFAKRTYHKGQILQGPHCKFADFGTRRRFSYDSQHNAIVELKKHPALSALAMFTLPDSSIAALSERWPMNGSWVLPG